MWEGLQNLPQMNFNPGVAADSSTNNSGIYIYIWLGIFLIMFYPALKPQIHNQSAFVNLFSQKH